MASALPGQLSAQWTFTANKDEISDKSQGVFRLPSSSRTSNSLGLPVTPILYIRCEEGALQNAYVDVKRFVTDATTVDLRWDSAPAVTEEWTPSNDNAALFAPEVAAFVDDVLVHTKLVFRFHPYHGAPETALFAIPTASTIAAQLKRHCGIDLAVRLSAYQEQVVAVVLTPTSDTVHLHGNAPLGSSLIKSVKARSGRLLAKYVAEFAVTQASDGRRVLAITDTLPVEPGANKVRITINGFQVPREIIVVADSSSQ